MSKFHILAPPKASRASVYQLNTNPLGYTLSLDSYWNLTFKVEYSLAILFYFKHIYFFPKGNRNKKKKKDKHAGVYDSNMDKMINNSIANSGDKKSGTKPAAVDDLPIYDDVGDYVPNLKKNRDRERGDRDRGDRDHHRRDRDHHR